MRLDLHIHTTASDGAWTPEAVVEGAARGRLDVIAIADHDTTAAVLAARAHGLERDVQVVPAVEMSSTWEGREIHILGYFVDPAAPTLTRHGVRARDLRDARMEEMVARLAGQGIEVAMDDVRAEAGEEASALSRPHLARVLVDQGHVRSVPDAFNQLIGDDHEAFVPTRLQTPAEAIAAIGEAGGIAVWAHPPSNLLDVLLPQMVEDGLRGLEVYRPAHRRSETLRLEALSEAHGLLRSGGSDWHNPFGGYNLGDFHVEAREIEALLAEGGL